MAYRSDHDALAAEIEVTRHEAAREQRELEQQLDKERRKLGKLKRRMERRVGLAGVASKLAVALGCTLLLIGLLLFMVRLACRLDLP